MGKGSWTQPGREEEEQGQAKGMGGVDGDPMLRLWKMTEAGQAKEERESAMGLVCKGPESETAQCFLKTAGISVIQSVTTQGEQGSSGRAWAPTPGGDPFTDRTL